MPGNLTPLMRQYLTLKEKYPDCLLFFRLGDFYELFFEDALTASKELEIVLTGRDCGLEERAPMCGVPYHAVDGYISRLIEKGFKVAICEQLSEPKPEKGLVERDVVRVITPGTVIEENMLDEHKNNFLLSLFFCNEKIGLAYADVSIGSFYLGEISGADLQTQLIDELERIQPTEIIANEALFLQTKLVRHLSSCFFLQQYVDWAYEENSAISRLARHFRVDSLDGYGCASFHHGVCAAGALLTYLEDTQKNSLAHITTLQTLNNSSYLMLDIATRRNLELTKPLHYDGSKKNTLLYLLDCTATAMGKRMLHSWVDQPLQKPEEIQYRLNAVSALVSQVIKRTAIKEALEGIYDIERLSSRIAYGTISARDCVALRASLSRLPIITMLIFEINAEALLNINTRIDLMEDVLDLLQHAITDEPPISIKEGSIIRQGYDTEVDRLREISINGKKWLTDLEAAEQAETGIKNLRIRYNKVFGYYIEVTKSYLHLVPYHYQRRQTLANAERYSTPALKELEETILGAEDQLISREYNLFLDIRERLLSNIKRIQNTAAALAELDVYQSLGQVAANNKYCMPKINMDSSITIKNGRHPVVERYTKDGFVTNDANLDIDDNRLIILTGPNMAGKSTYMRQIALIVLMAHMGSFVPADEASICITERIFTRVGATDNLMAGQSTFMVEMCELANILHNSGNKSLVLLDEIGRGTSTFDGLSIAWAVIEYLSKDTCRPKVLFATHYHELTELEGRLAGVKNYRIAVKEVGEDILFLRKIMRGEADKSFGIQVARLAGLPECVITRAKEILKELEASDINRPNSKREAEPSQQQLSLLFSQQKEELIQELTLMEIDSFSPLEALNLLNDMHQKAKRISAHRLQ